MEDYDELGYSLLLTLRYLSDLHNNKKLFHGDIKPANIFLDISEDFVTSDSGSVIPLFEDYDKFIPITRTAYFSSSQHSLSFEKKLERFKKDLLQEDFYQFK